MIGIFLLFFEGLKENMNRRVLIFRGARKYRFINLKIIFFSTSAASSDIWGRKIHKNMKKKNIITASALSLATIALAAGFAFNAYAQTGDTATANQAGNKTGRQFRMENNLTDEQKAEMEAKRTEMEAKMEANRAAMQTAINSGNYDTWVAAVKAQMGEQAPILSQVTADNFSQFVEAHKLMEQAREKLQAIGVDEGMGFGHGPEKGMGRGFGFNQSEKGNDSVQ